MSLAPAKPKPNLGRRTLVGLFAGLEGVLLGDTALAKGFIRRPGGQAGPPEAVPCCSSGCTS